MSRPWLRALAGAVAVAATFAVAVRVLVVGPLRDAAAAGAPAAAAVAPAERGLLLAGASAVVATAGWALWAGVVGERELRLARRALARIAAGDLRRRPAEPDLPELRALRERLLAEARDHAEAVGAVAHDLRSPLVGIQLAAERIARAHDGAERAAAVERVRRECERAARVADDVLCLCRAVGEGDRLATVGQVLDDVAGRLRDGRGVAVEAEPAAAAALCPDAAVARALANLADNAVRHAATDAGVRIRAREAAGGVEIAVEDDGPGFEPAAPQAFVRRGPRAGRAGLGLASAVRSARVAGGDVRLERIDGGGMRAVVRVPGAQGA